MADMERDLEKAFTNGDPEAMLDFLAIRSRQLQRCEEKSVEEGGRRREEGAVATCPLPLFSTDTDIGALARDLTIDDAISLCFADVPSGCGDENTSTTSWMLPAPRPERRLADRKTASTGVPPAASQKGSPRSTGPRPPAAALKQSSPAPSADSLGRGSGGKPRGFLSTLLGRGHKGRRRGGASQVPGGVGIEAGGLGVDAGGRGGGVEVRSGGSPIKSPSHHQRAMSWEHSDPSVSLFPFEHDGNRMLAPALVYLGPSHSSEMRVWKSEAVHGDDVADFFASEETATIVRQRPACVTHGHQETSGGNAGQLLRGSAAVAAPYPPQHATMLGGAEARPNAPAVHKSKQGAVTGHSFQNSPTFAGQGGNGALISSGQSVSSISYAHSLTHGATDQDHRLFPQTHVQGAYNPPSQHTQTPATDRPVAGAGSSADVHPDLLSSPRRLQTLPQRSAEKSANPLFSRREPKPPEYDVQTTLSQKSWGGLCDGVDAFIDFERDPNLEVPMPLDPNQQMQHELRPRLAGPHEGEPYKALLTQASGPSKAPSLAAKAMPQELSLPEGSTGGQGKPRPEAARHFTAPVAPGVSASHLPPPHTPRHISTSTQTEDEEAEGMERIRRNGRSVAQCVRTAIGQLTSLPACPACHDVLSRTLAELRKALLETEADHPSSSAQDAGVPQSTSGASQQTAAGKVASSSDGADAEKTDSLRGTPRSHGYKKPDPKGHGKTQPSQWEAGSQLKTSQANKKVPEQLSRRSKQKHVTSSKAPADGDSDSDASTVTSEPITVLLCQREDQTPSDSSKEQRLPNKADFTADSKADSLAAIGADVELAAAKSDPANSVASAVLGCDPEAAVRLNTVKTEQAPSSQSDPSSTPRAAPIARGPRKYPRGKPRYAGEAVRDYESFMTSSWSEMTSVSSISDVVTSADESSYYSGDDDDDADNDDDEDEEEEEEYDDDDLVAGVRLGLLDEDRDDNELRQHRLQRHLAAVLRQSSMPTTTVETVVAATGERLNSQERHVSHVNQGALYPFSPSQAPPTSFLAVPGHDTAAHSLSAPGSKVERGILPGTSLTEGPVAASSGASKPGVGKRQERTLRRLKKGGSAVPRLFSPDRQVSLVAARQMTSEEFREAYDRSSDISKAKRSQLDGDIPWDMIPCSDTDDDAGSGKAWYNVTSEEENVARTYCSDTDSSTTASDW